MNSGFTIIDCSCHQQTQRHTISLCVHTEKMLFLFLSPSFPNLSPFNARILNAIMIIPIGLHSTISTIKAVPKLTFCIDSYVLYVLTAATLFTDSSHAYLMLNFFNCFTQVFLFHCHLILFLSHSLRHYKYTHSLWCINSLM